MRRKAIETAGPKSPVKVEPSPDLVQRLGPKAAAAVLAFAFVRNERRFLQYFEVP